MHYILTWINPCLKVIEAGLHHHCALALTLTDTPTPRRCCRTLFSSRPVVRSRERTNASSLTSLNSGARYPAPFCALHRGRAAAHQWDRHKSASLLTAQLSSGCPGIPCVSACESRGGQGEVLTPVWAGWWFSSRSVKTQEERGFS